MSDILITSEYFGKFSPEARELLCKAGRHVIDNPYGHKALTPEEILPYAAKADAMICDLENINKDVIDAAKKLKIISRRASVWTAWTLPMRPKRTLRLRGRSAWSSRRWPSLSWRTFSTFREESVC